MFDSLREHWKKAVAALLSAVLIACFFWGWSNVSGFALDLVSMPLQVHSNTETVARHDQTLKELKAGVANLVALQREQKRRDLLLIGWAEIALDTTREVVHINDLTQAALYQPEPRIRITNLGGRNRATAVFEIAGNFSSPEAVLHVLLSRGAAERLGMERGGRFRVRLEPVE